MSDASILKQIHFTINTAMTLNFCLANHAYSLNIYYVTLNTPSNTE